MLKIIRLLADLAFPPRPSEQLVRGWTDSDTRRYFTPLVTGEHHYLAAISDPLIHALIIENKFHHSASAAEHLATILLRWIEQQPEPVLFIPIPLSPTRRRERGYNQVTEILKKLPATHRHLAEHILVRTVDTPPQTSLGRKERLTNVHSAFAVTTAPLLDACPQKHLVLIDDVVTTGATLRAARAALAPHLPPNTKLTTLALAH